MSLCDIHADNLIAEMVSIIFVFLFPLLTLYFRVYMKDAFCVVSIDGAYVVKCELYVHTHVPFVLSHFCIASANCRDLNDSKDV